MNKKGFTLVELIVVIAIIAILAVVGFTAYPGYISSARNSARARVVAEASKNIQVNAAEKDVPACDTAETGFGVCFLCQHGATNCPGVGIAAGDWDELEITTVPLDPRAGIPYIYVHKDNQFQVLATSEDGPTAIVRGTSNAPLSRKDAGELIIDGGEHVPYDPANIPMTGGDPDGINYTAILGAINNNS